MAENNALGSTIMTSVPPTDLKMIIRSVGLFVAPFEALLRQVEPAITFSQLSALDIIVHSGSIRPFQLGKQMMISRQVAWQICKRLETLGLVTMTSSDPQAGFTVVPTDAGIARLRPVAAIYEALATDLSRTDQVANVSLAKAVLRALGTAAANLEEGQQATHSGGRESLAERN